MSAVPTTAVAHPPETSLERHRTDAMGRSASQLVSGIASDASAMFRLELEAAKLDLKSEARRAAKGAAIAGAGGVALHLGALVLLFAAVWILSLWLDLWASALIVGAVVATVGAILLGAGRKQLQGLSAPTRALDETKQDVKWIREKSSV